MFCVRFGSDQIYSDDSSEDLKEDRNAAVLQDSLGVFTETGVCLCVVCYMLFVILHSVVCMTIDYFHICLFNPLFAPDVTLPSCLDGSPGSPETQTEGRFQRLRHRPNACSSSSSALTNVFQEMMANYTQLNVSTTEMTVSHYIQTQ